LGVGSVQISEASAALLAELLEGIRALESLPLDDVAPAIGDPRSP
jgi:hypothetical protein